MEPGGPQGARAIVAATLAAQVAVSMVQQGLPSVSIHIQRDLHVGLGGLGIVLGAANAATAASIYAWGRWSDRADDRQVLLPGLVMAVLGLAATGCAASSGSVVLTVAGLLVAGTGVASGTVALARLPGFPALLAANACYCVAQTGTVSLSVAAWHAGIGIGATTAVGMFIVLQLGSGVLRGGPGRAGDRRPNTVLFAAVGLTPPAMTAIAERAGWAACWLLLGACAAAGAVIHAHLLRSITQSTSRQEPPVCALPAPTTSS